MTGYELAKEKYAAWGVDTEAAMEQLKKVPVSLHCWQLDDVMGFDNDGALTEEYRQLVIIREEQRHRNSLWLTWKKQ